MYHTCSDNLNMAPDCLILVVELMSWSVIITIHLYLPGRAFWQADQKLFP